PPPHDRGEIPHGMISLCIEAGLAFGTGHHESTALCLSLLSDLAHRPIRKVLDLGAGTGLLAIAAAKLWKRPVLASDIDPAAVEVTRENARANGAGALVRAVAADGLSHPVLAGAAPYGLILANILAGPLARLAPQLVAAVAPGGTLILSGLLATQEATVIAFYHRLRLAARRRQGPWSALVLVKARR
ncbi:MAG: 50S ribosomal protein L11 methyltransferase, partial [Rhizomicrobium sp.]